MVTVPLSVVVPCYAPAADWQEQVISGYESFAEHTGERPELILVDDGNEPAIATRAAMLLSRIPEAIIIRHTPNRGKGYALRRGVAAAKGSIVLYTDIDFPYTTGSMLAVYQPLKDRRADVAAGVKDGQYYRSVPAARRIISKGLQRMTGLFLHMPVTDTQCGLKGFSRQAAPLFLSTTINRYLFDMEFLYLCFRQRPAVRVAAVPVALRPNVTFRKMNYRVLIPELKNFFSVLLKKRTY